MSLIMEYVIAVHPKENYKLEIKFNTDETRHLERQLP
jgi:hypothetical protein